MPTVSLLAAEPLAASDDVRRAVTRDYERFAAAGFPENLDDYLLQEFQIDSTAEYAGRAIKNPWGKASGQLSMTARQVEDDVTAGLGFVVLKSVIAQDASGEQSMSAWAIPEARMVAERVVGQSGESGWTITWKGRGWWQSFEAYLQLIRDARRLAMPHKTLIVPSCKYHLTLPTESTWRVGEYDFTTQRLCEAWSTVAGTSEPMPLEKDFSPTLAGSDRAAAQSKILEWLQVVPRLMRQAAQKSGHQIRVGMKVFNALFDDEFQIEMLTSLHGAGADRADYLIYANRLFDPHREFDGQRGVAFGGPDLSDRNLRVLNRFHELAQQNDVTRPLLPWSATGNITTGRMALEYALRGATSFQLHTFFQLPAEEYAMKVGNRTQRALHELLFHPRTGFIIWLHDVASRRGVNRTPLRFREIPVAALR